MGVSETYEVTESDESPVDHFGIGIFQDLTRYKERSVTQRNKEIEREKAYFDGEFC